MSQISNNAKVLMGVAAAAAIGAYCVYKYSGGGGQDQEGRTNQVKDQPGHPEEVKGDESNKSSFKDTGFGKNISLSKIEAVRRREIVGSVSYDLALVLPKGNLYHGLSKISFDLQEQDFEHGELFIDFQCETIHWLKINGLEVSVEEFFGDQRIRFRTEDIVKEGNLIEFSFTNKYRNTGTGLHKFKDPADGSEYLYTQFEPFHAHRAVPCFDQPDIKGSFKLSTVVPIDHVSLSNSHEEDEFTSQSKPEDSKAFMNEHGFEHLIEELGDYKVTKFGETPKISPYLYAIIAGPYDIVEKQGDIPGKSSPIRMRFMARKSISQYTSAAYDDMHEAVVTGIKWYTEFFGREFPWSKYDQIFCPEFKYGAMENVGAVTFSENYIPFDTFTEVHLTRLQNTTLHELCHQWFGNLCTMTWWNDLWLNEAFATYMAYLCTAENENLRKKTPGLWITLNTRKNFANNADVLSTTHPIIKDAVNTDSADDMVNAITYGKGSSFIKQLIHMIGKKCMSEGVKVYFKEHEWGNTTLDDFLNALEEGCKVAGVEPEVDLRQFCIDFLTSKGINKLSASCEDTKEGVKITFKQVLGKQSDLILTQKINYTLYDENMKGEEHSIILNNNTDPQVVEFPNRNTADTFILLNTDDQAYIQVGLKKNLVNKFKEGGLTQIEDSVNRIIAWRALIAMVKNCELKSTEFVEIVIANIPQERDIILLDTVLPTVKAFISSYIPTQSYSELCDKMFEKLLESLDQVDKENNDLKNVFKSNIVYFLESDENIKLASEWIEHKCIVLKDGTKRFDLYLLNPEKNYILKKIFASTKFDNDFKQQLLESQLGDDQSDRAQRLRITCETSLPDKESKSKTWDIVTHPSENSLSSYDYRAYLSGFFLRSQKDLCSEYVDKYLTELPNFARSGEKDHMAIFTSDACPPSYYDTDELIQKMQDIADSFEKEDATKYDSFLRILKSQIESKQSSIKIQKFAEKD